MYCFDNIAIGTDGYDYTYCIGNIIILIVALMNAILLSMMFVWHLSDIGCSKALKDTRTLIYLLIIGAQIVVAIDYSIAINGALSDVIVVLTFNLVTFSFMAVCYYFIEGASQLIDDSASIMKFMKIYTSCAAVLIVVSVIYISYFVFEQQNSDNYDISLCKKWFFIPPNVINGFTNLVFFT